MQYQWSCVTKTTHVLILMCLSNQLIFKLCSTELWNSVGLHKHVSFTMKCVNTFLIILNYTFFIFLLIFVYNQCWVNIIKFSNMCL